VNSVSYNYSEKTSNATTVLEGILNEHQCHSIFLWSKFVTSASFHWLISNLFVQNLSIIAVSHGNTTLKYFSWHLLYDKCCARMYRIQKTVSVNNMLHFTTALKHVFNRFELLVYFTCKAVSMLTQVITL